MSHRFVQSIKWKALKFDKANFPDLGPTVISDQIFSHILKAPDDVKQNHLSHSLSLGSIKFQQEIFYDCEASHFHPISYAGCFFLCNFVIEIWAKKKRLKFLTSSCAGVFSVHSSIRSKSLLRRQNRFSFSLQIFYFRSTVYKILSCMHYKYI